MKAPMLGVAARTVRFRAGGFAASFVAMCLSAVVVMAFASLLDTGAGPDVAVADRDTLSTMATVVGGWGFLIAVFAIASTLSLCARQRATELALLKNIGATPAQITGMIVGEALLLAVAATVVAIVPAAGAGRVLVALLRDSGQINDAVIDHFGLMAAGIGAATTMVSAAIAAYLAARRVASAAATASLVAAANPAGNLSRKRCVAGWLSLAVAVNLAVVTITVMPAADAQATAGQASIFAAIDLALLAPVLVRAIGRPAANTLEQHGGAAGYLAALNVRQRTTHMAGAVMPIVLFVGIAVGTLYMQHIDTAATAASGVATTAQQRTISTLNYVVVGIIAVFAAVLVINTVVAATIYRRREFGQQRLIGSSRAQTLRMVRLESIVVVVTGVAFGTVAALFTIIPYLLTRADSLLPHGPAWIYPAVVAVAAALTLSASHAAAGRAMTDSAIVAAGALTT